MAPKRQSDRANSSPNLNPSLRTRAGNSKYNPIADCTAQLIPSELQQTVLNVYRNAFPDSFSSELPELLQVVKRHLFERDFAAAFGNDDYLKAYALRWSPSRSLAYMR